jgi:hypothetical protein
MVPLKFKTLITMLILHCKYNFNSYETHGWIHLRGSFAKNASMVEIKQNADIWDEKDFD